MQVLWRAVLHLPCPPALHCFFQRASYKKAGDRFSFQPLQNQRFNHYLNFVSTAFLLMGQIVVGVLALQGDFKEHLDLLRSMKAEAREVRTISDLRECSALIIPGGESTTISNLLDSSGLGAEIKKRAGKGMPIYGTCAGAIIIARKVLREKMFRPLNLIDIEVERNAFGRQVDSFEAEIEVKG